HTSIHPGPGQRVSFFSQQKLLRTWNAGSRSSTRVSRAWIACHSGGATDTVSNRGSRAKVDSNHSVDFVSGLRGVFLQLVASVGMPTHRPTMTTMLRNEVMPGRLLRVPRQHLSTSGPPNDTAVQRRTTEGDRRRPVCRQPATNESRSWSRLGRRHCLSS